MAGAYLEAAHKRANVLCEAINQFSVLHDGRVLDKISVSIGVSIFPSMLPRSRNCCMSPTRLSIVPRAKAATGRLWDQTAEIVIRLCRVHEWATPIHEDHLHP